MSHRRSTATTKTTAITLTEDKLLTLSKIFDIFDTGMTGELRIAELD